MNEEDGIVRDPGDGSNLSSLQTQHSIWIDDRGIHLGFWDVPIRTDDNDPEELTVGLKEARYVVTFDPHALDKLIEQLHSACHAALDYELPWKHGVGAPAPFEPDLRYMRAGIKRLNTPPEPGPEAHDGGFGNPTDFDVEAWNRKLGTD